MDKNNRFNRHLKLWHDEINEIGEIMLQAKGIDHINMYVNNLESSKLFYKNLFGFEVYEEGKSPSNFDYAIIGKSNVLMLAIYENPDAAPEMRVNHIGINIDNFEEALSSIEKNSVEVSIYGGSAVVEYPNSKSIYVKDPDGNEIEISSHFTGGL